MDIATPRNRRDSVISETTYDTTSVQLRDTAPLSQKQQADAAAESSHHTSWEPDVAERIREEVEFSTENRPYMVALVGIPGSGKGVSSMLLANKLDEFGLETMIMPHDGYHYPLESLRIFPDAEDAIYRRGAPDTFDPFALLRDLKRIRDGDEDLITVPAFDHAKGDPEPDRHAFDRHRHRVVLCEGLYLLHDGDGWEDIASVFDLKIFMNSDVDNCVERVKIRNRCIPGYTPEEIDVRCEKVDRVNAMTVMKAKHRADLVVESFSKPPKPSSNTSMKPSLSTMSLKDIDIITDDNPFSDFSLHIPMESRVPAEDAISVVSNDAPEPPAHFARTWEPELVERIRRGVEESERLPYMVALVGCPGSGKTVSAFLVANELEQHGIQTMVMPHDGYHYPLEYLKTFPDAEDAIYRRGAPDTFDPHALIRDLERIRDDDEELITLPAFDHAKGDPEPDTHAFKRRMHKVVLCEGLYLLHDEDGWENVASMFDLTVFMDSDVDVCVERVKIRNRCIPGYTPEEIDVRCEKVDRVNAMTVMKARHRADMVVDSAASQSQES